MMLATNNTVSGEADFWADPEVQRVLAAVEAELRPAVSASAEGWPELIPLAPPPPPPFNLNWLPGVFGEYAAALAENVQAAPDLPGLLLLGAVSVASLGLFEVHGPWVEPTQLFVCIGLAPSERKSSVFGHVFRPIHEWEAEENRTRRAAVLRDKSKLDGLRAQLDRAAKKSDDSEVERISQEIAEFEPARFLRLTTSDSTPEALAGLMAANGGRLACVSDEAAVFEIAAGRYSKSGSANLDTLLCGFSGSPITIDRVSREPVRIPKPALACTLTVQPLVVRAIFSNNSMIGRGFASRFIWALPESMAGRRKIDIAPIPAPLTRRYAEALKAIVSTPKPDAPGALELSRDAARTFRDWRSEVEARHLGDLEGLAAWGWAGKLAGNTLRVAATLKAMEDGPAPGEITGRQMQHAIAIGRWAVEHAKAVSFGIAGSSESSAEQALEAIRRARWTEFTRRDFDRRTQNRAALRQAEARTQALQALLKAGYIAIAALSAEEEQRRVVRYLVNPRLYAPQAEQAPQEVEL